MRTIFLILLFLFCFTISLFAEELVSTGTVSEIDLLKQDIDASRQKLNDIEKNLKEIFQSIEGQRTQLQTIENKLTLLEGALGDLSLERIEQEKKLTEVEKYIKEEKERQGKKEDVFASQEKQVGILTDELKNTKDKLKNLEDTIQSLNEQITTLREKEAKTSVPERKLHSKNPKLNRFLHTLESPWVAPIALGLALLTFLIIIF